LDLSCEKEEILKNTKRKKNIIPTIKWKKVNCLLKHVTEGKAEGTERREVDVRCYWMTLRKREDKGNLKKKTLDGTL
jgi:hypothetical protein